MVGSLTSQDASYASNTSDSVLLSPGLCLATQSMPPQDLSVLPSLPNSAMAPLGSRTPAKASTSALSRCASPYAPQLLSPNSPRVTISKKDVLRIQELSSEISAFEQAAKRNRDEIDHIWQQALGERNGWKRRRDNSETF